MATCVNDPFLDTVAAPISRGHQVTLPPSKTDEPTKLQDSKMKVMRKGPVLPKINKHFGQKYKIYYQGSSNSISLRLLAPNPAPSVKFESQKTQGANTQAPHAELSAPVAGDGTGDEAAAGRLGSRR
ncbi:hypothetical protein DHEL01_v206672 [Diaporthe helianthi]|uniref:Uncharacterized protein n=1 Tax=Diaporthe helianthi TaxID=158607 RepID=A0A2P5HXG3_DIAHE|nr:hypothetical protein DHEL01_v206672 [Diaporthe helianthi]